MTIVKYSLFASFATLLNLLFQKISFSIYDGTYSIYLAMVIGTLVGLIVKFYCDKYFIFQVTNDDVKKHLQQFSLYSLTGIVTTAIFWSVELAFDYYFIHDNAKYIGAVLGLIIGYILKYQLDKTFVFRSNT